MSTINPEPFPLLNSLTSQIKSPDNGPLRRKKSSGYEGRKNGKGDTNTTTGIKSNGNGHALQLHLKRKNKSSAPPTSILRRGQQFALKHTWSLPLLLLTIILSLYALHPHESNPLHRFIFLSYPLPLEPGKQQQYGKGPWDLAFVTFYIIVLSFTREFIMQELLRPLAHACSVPKGKISRFMEQAYTALYFAILGPCGLYVMSRSPIWYFDILGMYEGSPHKTHEALFKFYYLFQGSYWAQQAIVLLLGLEAPRKDFKELVAHHIATISLIAASYRFHFTYMGLPVYLSHDISDCVLSLTKSLLYMDSMFAIPCYFINIFVWTYLRHYQNLRILWSMLNEFQTVGPYELDWVTGQYKSPLAFYIAFSLLSVLQSLNLFWLYCLIRNAYRYLFYNIKKDDRSEDEEEEEEEEIVEIEDMRKND